MRSAWRVEPRLPRCRQQVVIAARWTSGYANFGKKHPYTAASYNNYSRVLRIRDELIEAEKEVGKAIVINRKVYGSGGLPLAANLNELAR